MKEENYPTGAFVAFVLLSQNEWDIKTHQRLQGRLEHRNSI